MRLNQDVRGDAKKCARGYAIATPLAYARVYPEPQAGVKLTHIVGLPNMNSFQLTTFQGDDIFQYYMAISSI